MRLLNVASNGRLLPLAALMIAIISLPSLSAKEWTVVVSAGSTDRAQMPVSVRAPFDKSEPRTVSLVDSETGQEIDAQLTSGPDPKLIWILQRPLPADSTRTYTLKVNDDDRRSEAPFNVECLKQGGHLVVNANGRPVLQYNAAINEGPIGTSKSQARSAYIHPLFTPNGQVITDDFAPDHVHQRGLFLAWTKARLGERNLNFWELQQNTGKIVHVGVKAIKSGDVFAQFVAEHDFIDLHKASTPETVLKEQWTVRVYNVTDGFLIDLKSEQTCVADEPLVIGPYHYGGMAIRGRREWINPAEGYSFSMRTSDGLDREQGNHSRPKWVDFGGRLHDKPVGLVSFCHPSNFLFPQPVRLHPTKPYFCFAPLVLESFEIKPGRTYTSRYRFLVYSGDKDPDRAARLWSDYAEPPTATISP